MITRKDLIKKYLEFFKSHKKYPHKEVQNFSLIPSNDPTALFTTAGMHPLTPYLLDQKHPLGKRLVNVQKCIRTTDINFVGDAYHHTFFEMLGNWSLGDYWKDEAIKLSWEFLTSKKWLNLEKKKIAVSVFSGNKDAPRDEESAKIWFSLGIPKERLMFLLKENNWWGPVGLSGPCGPDTEMFYWTGKEEVPKVFDPNNEKWVEIWNNVFMQYNKTEKGKFEPLKKKNVDTGMGVERTLAILNGLEDNYKTEVFKPVIEKIEKLSNKKYKGNERVMRIISDHIKASVFIIANGVAPSNTGQGYVLRRLIRRAVYFGKELGINDISKIVEPIFKIYEGYSELKENKKDILKSLDEEQNKFNKTLEIGIKKVEEMAWKNKIIPGKEAFLLRQSHGVPLDVIIDVADKLGSDVDVTGFEAELSKHQELSRTSSAGTFKSGLADYSEKTVRLHTATHLLNESLRKILGQEVKQRGSNITPERLRFDFSFPRKLSEEELRKVEKLVNDKINQGLEVKRSEMKLKDAIKSGAQAEFGAKYPEIVSVYLIGDFSKEICTGPHVKNTKDIGKFKIIKEEAIAAGIRRIKAVVE